MRITDEVRAFARDLAGGRCECQGSSCRHHLRGSRCKRGLRQGQWKVYWHSEMGGMTRSNLDAWCLDCFANNFTVPTSSVTILSADIAGYPDLLDADRRKAITAMAVLRDMADVVAAENKGRLLASEADEVRLEFAKTSCAIAAARSLQAKFHDTAAKLSLPAYELLTGVHKGEVTRSRDGDLFGDTLHLASLVKAAADAGQIVVSADVVEELGTAVEVEEVVTRPIDESSDEALHCWALV